MKEYLYYIAFAFNGGTGDCTLTLDSPLNNTDVINQVKDYISKDDSRIRSTLSLQNCILLNESLTGDGKLLKYEVHTSCGKYLILAKDEFSAKIKFSSKHPSEKIRKIQSSVEEVFEILGEE